MHRQRPQVRAAILFPSLYGLFIASLGVGLLAMAQFINGEFVDLFPLAFAAAALPWSLVLAVQGKFASSGVIVSAVGLVINSVVLFFIGTARDRRRTRA